MLPPTVNQRGSDCTPMSRGPGSPAMNGKETTKKVRAAPTMQKARVRTRPITSAVWGAARSRPSRETRQ